MNIGVQIINIWLVRGDPLASMVLHLVPKTNLNKLACDLVISCCGCDINRIVDHLPNDVRERIKAM